MCTLKRIQIRKSYTYKYLFEDQTHSSETGKIQCPENKEHNARRVIQVSKTHEMVLAKIQVEHVHSTAYIQWTDLCNGIKIQVSKESNLISMFHCAFFNSIIDKQPTHALFHSTLY